MPNIAAATGPASSWDALVPGGAMTQIQGWTEYLGSLLNANNAIYKAVVPILGAGILTQQEVQANLRDTLHAFLRHWPTPQAMVAQLASGLTGSQVPMRVLRMYSTALADSRSRGDTSGTLGRKRGGGTVFSNRVEITQNDLKWYLTRWLQLHAVPSECNYGFPGYNAIKRNPITPAAPGMPISAKAIVCDPTNLGQCGAAPRSDWPPNRPAAPQDGSTITQPAATGGIRFPTQIQPPGDTLVTIPPDRMAQKPWETGQENAGGESPNTEGPASTDMSTGAKVAIGLGLFAVGSLAVYYGTK